MIYYKNNSSNEIRAFNSTEEAKNFINFDDFSLLSADETLKLNTPKPSRFHTEWNGAEWIDLRTEQQKAEYNRSQYKPLTRYQFKRCLLENGYKSEMIEAKILMIEDEMIRELTLLGFKEATNFVRTDDSISTMQSVLNLSDEQVDELWEYALTL